jgi:hypothetical protein
MYSWYGLTYQTTNYLKFTRALRVLPYVFFLRKVLPYACTELVWKFISEIRSLNYVLCLCYEVS